ncbi:hypothetical protein TDB9533_03099 [Thalassocella blandensis]|nr:hypothetical protein TDB9533_03099 [Thalassocella blandensis]
MSQPSSSSSSVSDQTHPHSLLEKILNIFAKVHAREGPTSLLLLTNIFLILVAYYFIKPVREGWLSVSVISNLSKLEVKAYSAFGQSFLLLAILPLYSFVSAHVSRRKLITGTGAVSAVCLLIFWLCQPGLLVEQIPFAGVMFYIFVGVFSVTLIAQFWSFAADIYGEERGKRLFPLIAVGASSGAMVGSWLGEYLMKFSWISAFDLILVSLIPLGLAIALANWTDKRGTRGHPSDLTVARWNEAAAPNGEGALRLIFKHQYLTITAVTIMLFNWVVASGDNILFGLVQQAFETTLPEEAGTDAYRQALKEATTAFYSSLYFWINLIGLILQAFIVSRLIQFGGFSLLIITTPIISLATYLTMAIAPVLGIIKMMKIAENSSNYSINNTARHMIWLPTTKEMMYQAKATVDTLFVRMGDGLAALTVLLGTRYWSFSLNTFLIINLVLSFVWVLLALYLTREYKRWSHAKEKQAPTEPQPSL